MAKYTIIIYCVNNDNNNNNNNNTNILNIIEHIPLTEYNFHCDLLVEEVVCLQSAEMRPKKTYYLTVLYYFTTEYILYN